MSNALDSYWFTAVTRICLSEANLHMLIPTVCLLSQSLTGHKNPVECVQFNVSEDQIVTGSQSGSIRVWDMEAAKSKTQFVLCVCVGYS